MTIIRPYNSADRDAVRRLCCETGFLGKPIDSVFEDRELFADYLTSYYTDVEPESCFVLDEDGVVKGYLIGSRRPLRQKIHDLAMLPSLVLRALVRYRRYNDETKKYIRWIVCDSRREVSPHPKGLAHFHFNVLPEAQSMVNSRKLYNAFMDYVRSKGEKGVYGQMITFDSRRSEKTLARFGFQAIAKSEISKWRSKYPEPVYLTTAVRYF